MTKDIKHGNISNMEGHSSSNIQTEITIIVITDKINQTQGQHLLNLHNILNNWKGIPIAMKQ